MNRTDAERVFDLVASLHGELHDRLVPERWWLVWALMGVQILVVNLLTHWLIVRGELRPGVHFSVFGVQVVGLALTIRVAQRHGGGGRTQREAFVWWIWTTFLLAATVALLLNHLLGLPMFRLACVLPLLAAVGFSMMGMAVRRGFAVAAVGFAACSVAMALWPGVQFVLYGLTWFVSLEIFAYLHRPAAARAGRAL